MSTRASIVLKLKDEDIGKKMKFEPSRLPLGITCDMAGVDKVEWVELSKRYIMIYHNYDSYPSGMGVYLYYIYNDYDKIINLLLGGNVSSILGTMLMQYICYPDGVWADEKPIVYDEMPEKEEDYIYLFESGIWYLKSNRYPEWVDLEMVLRAERDKLLNE